MPKTFPPLAKQLRARGDDAIDLASLAETLRVHAQTSPPLRRSFSTERMELLYEAAYLRFFSEWEAFLEESFIRYLAGYRNSSGPMLPVAGTTLAPSTKAAFGRLLGAKQFLLWHSPKEVIKRSKVHFQNGLHEQVISSALGRIEDFAAIRHHIAHRTANTRSGHDAATMRLCGRRYRGGRAGAFLRDKVAGTGRNWLREICDELCALSAQIIP